MGSLVVQRDLRVSGNWIRYPTNCQCHPTQPKEWAFAGCLLLSICSHKKKHFPAWLPGEQRYQDAQKADATPSTPELLRALTVGDRAESPVGYRSQPAQAARGVWRSGIHGQPSAIGPSETENVATSRIILPESFARLSLRVFSG